MLGERSPVQVDGGGKSPTKDSGRSRSDAGIGGDGILESCLAFVSAAATALKFGSLMATPTVRGDIGKAGSSELRPMIGDSTGVVIAACGMTGASTSKIGNGSLGAGMAERLREAAYDVSVR